MRYPQLSSFQKHLTSAAPSHLCHCYLLAVPDEYERRRAVKAVLSSLGGRETSLVSLEGGTATASAVAEALAPSLFGGEPVVFLDEAEKMSKEELGSLTRALPSFGYLLLGVKGKIPAPLSAVEKEGVVLDLSEEKPWEREKRLLAQLGERAANARKRLPPEMAALLLERVGPDPAALDAELDKLICFVGERPSIGREDFLQAGATLRSATTWQMAEEIVWEKKGAFAIDPSAFGALLPAIRFQLQIGLKIASLLERRAPPESWGAFFPKVWPKTLEKRAAYVEQRGSAPFRRALEQLCEIEQLSRSGASSPLALLDLFRSAFYAAG